MRHDGFVARGRRLAEAFRAAGALVVLVRVTFSPDGGDALRTETDEPPVVLEMSDGWDEIVDGLLADGDVVVTKHQQGAFYGTDLDLQLRRRGISTVVLGAIATNMGVESRRGPRTSTATTSCWPRTR